MNAEIQDENAEIILREWHFFCSSVAELVPLLHTLFGFPLYPRLQTIDKLLPVIVLYENS